MIAFSRLRRISRSDVGEIQRLLRQLTRPRQRLAGGALRRVFKQEGVYILIARDGRKIIGMGALIFACIPSGCSVRIEDVVVDEVYRGQGVGRKIMERLVALARKKKAEYVELTSRPSRIAANKLYQKMGFEQKDTNVYRLRIQ